MNDTVLLSPSSPSSPPPDSGPGEDGEDNSASAPIFEAILRDAPRRLVQLHEEVVAGSGQDRWPGERTYTRRKLARVFETFLNAEHKPFAPADSPYHYPCFDLVDYLEYGAQVALLAVDIHT